MNRPWLWTVTSVIAWFCVTAIYGQDCTTDGKFGGHCYFDCHCDDGVSCDKTTGQCPPSTACSGIWSQLACQLGDVSRGKTCKQSSEYQRFTTMSANNAIDGIYDTTAYWTCTHTAEYDPSIGDAPYHVRYPNAWWQIDFGAPYVIYSLILFNRIFDPPLERLSYFDVRVGNNDESSISDNAFCQYYNGSVSESWPKPWAEIECTETLRGRYLSVQLRDQNRGGGSHDVLTICEVYIRGYKDCIAIGKSGPGCQNNCWCYNQTECTALGNCTSGCTQGRLGKYCMDEVQLEKPVIQTEMTSVNLQWRIWKATDTYVDSGRGAVGLIYVIEYNSNNTTWTEASGTITASADNTEKSMYVTGLSRNVFYKFKVKLMTSPSSSGRTVAVSDEVYKCGEPSAPSNVVLSPGCGTGNSASIGVTWTDSDSRCTGDVTYKIWYLAQGDENNGKTTDNVQSPHILDSLLFSTTYWIRVEARNTAGLNATLDPVQSTTISGELRDVSPKPAVVDQVQTRQCRVTFYQLDCGDRNGPFHSFHYKLVDKSYGTLGSGDTSLSSYQLVNLIPYTNYTIQYTWNNANGSSDWSGNVSFTTLQEKPQKPSVLVDARATYIRLNVTLPYPPHAYLTQVVAVCTCQRSCQTTIINQISSINADISASVLIMMTENVEPSKNYSCAAYVRSAAGDSEWSDWKSGETIDSTSSAPRDFTIVNRNTQQVRLQYKTPLQQNGVITTYMYECNAIATDNPSLKVDSIPSIKAQESIKFAEIEIQLTREYTLDGLSSSTQYSCQIWAVNGAGNGLPANITFWTRAERIQLPDNIKVELDALHSTSSSVSVILPQITLKTVRIRVYRVVVEMSQPELSRRLRSLNTSLLSAYNKISSQEPYIAAEWNDIRTSFIVGDNQTYNGYYNPQLVTGQNYIIHYGVGSVVDGIADFAFLSMDPVTVGSYGDSKQPIVGGVMGGITIALIIALVTLLSAFIYLYRHGRIRLSCYLFTGQQRADSVDTLVDTRRENLQDSDNANLQNACEAADVTEGVDNITYVAFSDEGLVPYPESSDIVLNNDHSRVILTDSGDGDDVADYNNASLVTHLHNADRDIPKTDFITKWTSLKNTQIKAEYQVLDMIRTADMNATKSGLNQRNLHKNYLTEIIPEDHERSMMSTSIEGTTDAIKNAVFLENLTASPMCLATQRPLPDTIPDLWRLVHDYRIRTIVVLDKEPTYENTEHWPMPGFYDPYEIEVMSSTQTTTDEYYSTTGEYSTTDLRLSNTMNESIPPIDVKVFQCNDWPGNVPTSTSSLVELYEAVKLWQGDGKEAILIQCSDGAMKCGLYGAIYCVLQSMINQDTISIYKATRITQSTRPQLISNLVQYGYMYDVIHDLLESRDENTAPEPHADDSECAYDNF